MLRYALLGVVQGLTEFFPVSSKGHLIFLQHVLGVRGEEFVLPVVLHAGTLVAVIVFLRRDIRRLFSDLRMLKLIAVSTAVTGAIGVAGKELLKSLFLHPAFAGAGMLFTAAVLLLSSAYRRRAARESLGLADALYAGLAQAVALLPGVSRSGMTISSLLARKVDASAAFIFSFLISIPAVLGVSLLEIKDIAGAACVDPAGLSIGFLCSVVSGLAALALLKRILLKDKFHYFGYYCLLFGLLIIFTVKGGRV